MLQRVVLVVVGIVIDYFQFFLIFKLCASFVYWHAVFYFHSEVGLSKSTCSQVAGATQKSNVMSEDRLELGWVVAVCPQLGYPLTRKTILCHYLRRKLNK